MLIVVARLQRKLCVNERRAQKSRCLQTELLRRPKRRHSSGASSRRSSRSRSRETEVPRASRAAAHSTSRLGCLPSARLVWIHRMYQARSFPCATCRGATPATAGFGRVWKTRTPPTTTPGPVALDFSKSGTRVRQRSAAMVLAGSSSASVAAWPVATSLPVIRFRRRRNSSPHFASRNSRARQSKSFSTSRGVGQPSTPQSGGGSPPYPCPSNS